MTGKILSSTYEHPGTAAVMAAAEQLMTSAVASRIRQSANQHLKLSKYIITGQPVGKFSAVVACKNRELTSHILR